MQLFLQTVSCCGFALADLTCFEHNHNVVSNDGCAPAPTPPLYMADVWADALNAFIDHNLWSIQRTWKLLMPEIIQFKGH